MHKINPKLKIQVFMRALALISIFCALAACALGSNIVDHSFGFDMRHDDQDAEVLDYRYGDSELPSARNPESLRGKGEARQSANINGPMRKGDFLYVKWRTKDTGQIYEDTVDLRDKLPTDITDHIIYFMIRGPQLYVYLVSPERRSPGTPLNGPQVYAYRKTTTVYPVEIKPQELRSLS